MHKCHACLITCQDFRLHQRRIECENIGVCFKSLFHIFKGREYIAEFYKNLLRIFVGRNYVAEFIRSLNIDCDPITRAGGVLDLVRPAQDNHDTSVLRDTEVSAELHQVETAFLLNHEDCGAYNSMKFSGRGEEFKQHYADLHEAKDKILSHFPNVKVRMFFAELMLGSDDIFIIKEIF